MKVNERHLARLYNRYKLLALNMFEWRNLPKTIESRHIEHALYGMGKALFFEHKDLGLICLPCAYSSEFNVYGEANKYIVSGYGYSKIIEKGEKAQIILNNDLGIANDEYVRDYSIKMYEVERCINANIKQQKFPYFINGSREQKLSLQKMFEKVEDGEPYIYGNKQIGIDSIEVLKLETPYIVDKLNHYKYELEREILTFFGLNNNYEKKERLLVDEVNSNNDFISRNVDIMYKNRLLACEEINKKFGLNIEVVKLNDDGEKSEKDRENEVDESEE